jgi:hypothetical protein
MLETGVDNEEAALMQGVSGNENDQTYEVSAIHCS